MVTWAWKQGLIGYKGGQRVVYCLSNISYLFLFYPIQLFITLRVVMGVVLGGTWPAMHAITGSLSLHHQSHLLVTVCITKSVGTWSAMHAITCSLSLHQQSHLLVITCISISFEWVASRGNVQWMKDWTLDNVQWVSFVDDECNDWTVCRALFWW